MKNIEQEIECPHCHDIMTLSSDFTVIQLLLQQQ